MKLSILIKLSLSALAITVSMPMRGEAAQAARAQAQARRAAAEQAERERAAAEAAAQQQAAQVLVQQPPQVHVQQQAHLAQQQQAQALLLQQQRQQEEQRQREEVARQQVLLQQQEERRQREEAERRQREEAARQQEAQRQQREAQEALARQQEAQRQQALLQQQAQAQALAQQQALEEQRKREAAALQSDLHPAWALFRDIKANYLIFTDKSGMGEQKAREITTREIKDYDQPKLEREVHQFTQNYLKGTRELAPFMDKFNALLKESPGHRLALMQSIQTHHKQEITNRQTAKAKIEKLEKEIQGIDNQTEALEKQLQKENLPQDKNTRKSLKAEINKQKDDLYEQRHLLIDQKKESDKVLDITDFTYFNSNPDERMSPEEKIEAVVDAALLIDPQLSEKAALFFARSVSHAPQSGTNIDHRIGYALQALEMMKLYNKQLKFQDLEISPKTNRDFNQAKSNLSSVHQHIQENFDGQDPDAKRLDNTNFKKAIS